MSFQGAGAAGESPPHPDVSTGSTFTVTLGATVPTGFEHTAAEEVQEKIGVDARISRDRGRIYFPVTTDKLFQVSPKKRRWTDGIICVQLPSLIVD